MIQEEFDNLLIISNILKQYLLLFFSNLPPISFKVSAVHHFGLDPLTPLQSISSVSILAQTAHPPKRADVILERSLSIFVANSAILSPTI